MNGECARRENFLTHPTRCEAALRAFIAGALSAAEDRADLFQEIALILWRLFDRYDTTRPFQPWALGVAVRRMKEEYRRRSRSATCLAPEILERLAAELERHAAPAAAREEESALAECLNSLPANSAMLVKRRYYDGAPIEMLCEETGQSPAALYQMLSRIRQRLGECIRLRLRRPHIQPVATHEI